MKRIVSLILTLAMVLSLMAGMAVGVSALEEEYIYLGSAEVNGSPIPELQVGDALPELSYTVPEGANYTVLTYWWENNLEVPAGTIVQDGNVYTLWIEVYAKEGYAFSHGFPLLINGEEHSFMPVNGRGEGFEYCAFSQDYPFLSSIDKVELSYAEPEEGKALTAPAVPDGANYTIDYFRWYDYEAGEEVASGALAQTGGRYDLYVQISAAEGYMFTEDMQLWVNGQQEEDISYSAAEFTWNSDIYDLSIPISKVEITYTEPEVGKELAMPVAKGTTYTVSEETQWYDYVTGEYLEPGTVAQNGHKYELMIHVDAATGYKFLDEMAFWVNGAQVSADDVFIDGETIYYCTQIFDFTEKISEVSVTCAEPVVGQPFPQAVIPSDVNYSVATTWYDGYTDETVTGNVQDGGIYYVELYIEPAAGYEFVEDTNVTFNGEVQGEYDCDRSADRLILNEVYSFAQPLDKIEVFYELPEAGKAPGAITIPEGANYSLNEENTGWFYNRSYDKVTGVFEDGYRYDLEARVELERGYQLEPYVTQIYVNGKMYTYTGGGGNWLDTAVTVYGISFSLAESIDKVELPAWPELKVGDTLPSISGGNEYYDYYYIWEAFNADGDYINAVTVEEDMVYCCYAMAEPKEGYEFTEDTVITLGGAPLSAWGDMSYTYASDTKAYNFGAVQELDTFNVIASVPGIGQSGGAVAIPADAGYVLEEAIWMVASDESFEDMATQESTYKAGDRVGLLVAVGAKNGYSFKCGATLTLNGQECPMLEIYSYYDLVYAILDLGEVQAAPNYNGLTLVDGVWGYYIDGVLQVDYTGLVHYEGEFFYVENGILEFDYTGLVYYMENFYYVENSVLNWGYTGLVQYMGNWYYVQEGALQWGYYGLVCYNGVWFYVENSTITFTYNGLVLYEGVWFYVENSSITFAYTGLVEYGGNYYYVENSSINWSYTGLAMHNGNFYYVENGVLNFGYTGLATYMGNWYYVANGVLDWSYSSLCLYNGVWYVIQGGQLIWGYDGLVCYNDLWFYAENSMITFTFTGLAEHEGILFYFEGSCLNWSYNGKATYNGVEYDVVNGMAFF